MRYIKRFLLFLESVTNTKKIKDWFINYLHNKTHDLNDRIKRTNINNFDSILVDIINDIEINNLNGSYTFVSFNTDAKIVANIDINNKSILIITFLGKDEHIKKHDKIRLI